VFEKNKRTVMADSHASPKAGLTKMHQTGEDIVGPWVVLRHGVNVWGMLVGSGQAPERCPSWSGGKWIAVKLIRECECFNLNPAGNDAFLSKPGDLVYMSAVSKLEHLMGEVPAEGDSHVVEINVKVGGRLVMRATGSIFPNSWEMEVWMSKRSPRFSQTSCSHCGAVFGPGDHGFSHCKDHRGLRKLPDNEI
jgi:hypothetical protein